MLFPLFPLQFFISFGMTVVFVNLMTLASEEHKLQRRKRDCQGWGESRYRIPMVVPPTIDVRISKAISASNVPIMCVKAECVPDPEGFGRRFCRRFRLASPFRDPPRHRCFYTCPDQSPQTVLTAAGFCNGNENAAPETRPQETQDSHLPYKHEGGRGSAAALENVFEPPSSTFVLFLFHSQLAPDSGRPSFAVQTSLSNFPHSSTVLSHASSHHRRKTAVECDGTRTSQAMPISQGRHRCTSRHRHRNRHRFRF